MIILFLLDVLVYNLTSYNIPLFIIGLPFAKKLKIPIIFFVLLILIDYRYIITFVVVILPTLGLIFELFSKNFL